MRMQSWLVTTLDEISMIDGRSIASVDKLSFGADWQPPFAFLMSQEQIAAERERVLAQNGKLHVMTYEPPDVTPDDNPNDR